MESLGSGRQRGISKLGSAAQGVKAFPASESSMSGPPPRMGSTCAMPSPQLVQSYNLLATYGRDRGINTGVLILIILTAGLIINSTALKIHTLGGSWHFTFKPVLPVCLGYGALQSLYIVLVDLICS